MTLNGDQAADTAAALVLPSRRWPAATREDPNRGSSAAPHRGGMHMHRYFSLRVIEEDWS
jgi:hypothetical protein